MLNLGVETAGNVTDGQFSVLTPLLSTLGENGTLSGTLLYAEPYGAWIERGSVEAGLGLGMRRLFGGQPNSRLRDDSGHVAGFMEEGFYIGADVSADMLQNSNDVRYWQMGLGAEIGTRYLELRGHYYIPLTNGETTTHNTSNTYRSSVNQSLGSFGRFTGTSVTTVRTSTEVLHESLEGWDVESAVLVPWLDQWADLKLVGGYASFHSTSLDAIQYDSWKAGVELRPFPACVLSATWYENERLVGDHWMYGIRLELPFETADIGDGKGGFWGHIKDAFKSRRRHLAERLMESPHARRLQPQTASYVTKASFDFRNRTRSALILADGTVISVQSSVNFQNTYNRASSVTLSGTSTSNASVSTGTSSYTLTNSASNFYITAGVTSTLAADIAMGSTAGATLNLATAPNNGSTSGSTTGSSSGYYSGAVTITGGSVNLSTGGILGVNSGDANTVYGSYLGSSIILSGTATLSSTSPTTGGQTSGGVIFVNGP